MAVAQLPTHRSPRQSRVIETGEATGVAWRAKAGRPVQIVAPVIAPAASTRDRRDIVPWTWMPSRRGSGVLIRASILSLFIGSKILSLAAFG
jgi:hypothetical protein